jgi:hypothetical protein
VEQRIGSNSQPLKAEPVTGAGFDPAFIPGLTSPVSGGPADAAPEKPAEQQTSAEPEAAVPDGAVPEGTAAVVSGTSDGADDADSDEVPDGPVFEASDRRAKIVADHRGVRLALDDQACEFRWDEIGAVETESPRFGKRFTITVHTPDRRWYPIEIEAASRKRFEEWDEQLDAVLDAYFEDGDEDEDTEADAATEDVKAKGADSEDADTKDADTKAES